MPMSKGGYGKLLKKYQDVCAENDALRKQSTSSPRIAPALPAAQVFNPKPSMRAVEVLSAVLTVLGGLGLMFVDFWTGISVLNVFAALLAILLACEKGIWLRLLIVPWVAGIGWIDYLVLHPTPIEIQAMDLGDNSTVPPGFMRRSDLTYLHLAIVNGTDEDLSNVDLVVKPDVSIVAIDNISGASSGCVLHGDVTKEMVTIGTIMISEVQVFAGQGNTRQSVPVRQLATPVYRVVCLQIVKYSSVDFVMALGDLDVEDSPGKKEIARLAPQQPMTFAGGAKEQFGTLFEGPRDFPESAFVYRKTAPKSIEAAVSYVAHFRPIHRELTVPVNSWLQP